MNVISVIILQGPWIWIKTSRARQPIHTGLSYLYILSHRTAAYADSTDQVVVFEQGQPTTKDHQTSIGLLNTIQCLIGLRLIVQSSAGDAIEEHTCSGFLDRYVNTARVCIIHAQESNQKTRRVRDSYILRDYTGRGLCCCRDYGCGLVCRDIMALVLESAEAIDWRLMKLLLG